MPQKKGNFKACSKCKQTKPLSFFYAKSSTPDGLGYQCKKCTYESIELWRKSHRQQYLKIRSAYTQRQRETGEGKYGHIRSQAKRKGQIFNWERTDFAKWFDAQEKVCHYCGRKIGVSTQKGGGMTSLSLDCKNPSLGYQKGNLVLACVRCNVMKGNWLSEAQMLDAGSRYLKGKKSEDLLTEEIRKEEQARLLKYLNSLLDTTPKASLAATIDLIETSRVSLME